MRTPPTLLMGYSTLYFFMSLHEALRSEERQTERDANEYRRLSLFPACAPCLLDIRRSANRTETAAYTDRPGCGSHGTSLHAVSARLARPLGRPASGQSALSAAAKLLPYRLSLCAGRLSARR